MTHKPQALVSSPTEPFLVPGLPDLRITIADLGPPFDVPEPAGPHWDFVCESCSSMYSSRGIIANSFSELESVYIDLWNRDFDIKTFGDRGKVVEGFINQLGVLGHKSVKGFFTHCGWNSVLESITMGVPILAFPMAAEQKLNAKFVVDVIHMGLRVWPKEDAGKESDGLVVSGDVQALARELIFGEEGRRAAARASELSVSSRKTMEVGGSSYENLAKMVQEVSETNANGG
ncbi:UDP-glycosyltransferase 90A1 [Triticum urartu]|uniref:UDP-glycosyltransferase 90A1 n=1 Tax=Triticum urartu TaxID=4572 RepID=M7Z2V7_TRIUA|nr:UDP-glycosyltransferase 90A1 [Triticum urartu]